ncbi:TetR/AcrR family transcriptional regulator [Patescibacteria group bacterium]|nr:TetR/AcrR family transcriptional regulator [Patescibacteria group bacterium]
MSINKNTSNVNTKDKIIKTAARLFSQRSYYGVSMDKIAFEVGVSKSTLYYYFESKEQLLKTVLNTSCTRLKEKLSEVVYDSKDPIDFIFSIVRMIVDYGIANPEIKLLTSLGITGQDEFPVTKFIVELRTELLIFIRELLGSVSLFKKWTFKVLSVVSMNILSFALNPFIQDLQDSDEITEKFSSMLSKSIESN